MKLPPVSIVTITLNRASCLDRSIQHMLELDYPEYEIVVVDGGSKDDTNKVLEKYSRLKNFKTVYCPKPGIPAAKNAGIENSKYDLVAFVDDDNMVTKDWLRILVTKLLSLPDNIAATTSVWKWSGHAMCYKKKALYEAGLFDERFTKLRDDTDLAFRIFDRGYDIVQVPEAKFNHETPLPNTVPQKIKYILHRLKIHEFDVLLFKKHPKRAADYFDVKFNFLIPPIRDFKIATGLWQKNSQMQLGSRGVVIVSGENILGKLMILVAGIAYAFVLKIIRFSASIKYGKLLI